MRPPRRLRRRWFPVCGRESPGSGEAAFALGEAVFAAHIARGQDRLARPSDPRASAGDLLTAKPVVDDALGELPTWNLADLYAGPDSPALKADLDACAGKARAFRERCAGRSEEHTSELQSLMRT